MIKVILHNLSIFFRSKLGGPVHAKIMVKMSTAQHFRPYCMHAVHCSKVRSKNVRITSQSYQINTSRKNRNFLWKCQYSINRSSKCHESVIWSRYVVMYLLWYYVTQRQHVVLFLFFQLFITRFYDNDIIASITGMFQSLKIWEGTQ